MTNSSKVEIFHRNNSTMRWLVLITVSFAVFGAYFAYDSISPARRVLENELGFGPSSFSWLVGIYSLPNVLGMTLFGGILADRKGIRFAGMLFMALTVFGVLLTSFGGSTLFRSSGMRDLIASSSLPWSPEFIVMFTGRIIFGMGAEVLIVMQEKIIVRWFKGREISLAFGIGLVICRIGTIAAFNVTTFILESGKLLSFSFISDTAMMMVTDSYTTLDAVMWLSAIIMLLSAGSFMLYLAAEKRFDKDNPDMAATHHPEGGSVSAIFKSPSFIWMSVLCFAFYAAVFPFTSFATDILKTKFGVSAGEAGFLTSIVMTSTIIGTPLFGWIIDNYGFRSRIMITGAIMMVAAHSMLTFTTIYPAIPMVIMGISFSAVPAGLWPGVAIFIEEKNNGAAYGFLGIVQNVGLLGVPLLMGLVTELTNPGVTAFKVNEKLAVWNYTAAQIVLVGFASVSLVAAWMIRRKALKENVNFFKASIHH